MACRSQSRTGFTLLELTAVVVLIAMVAAAVVPGLARGSIESARRQLVAGLIDLDARARLNASRNDACFLSVDEDTNQIVLMIVEGSETFTLDRVEIPEGVSVGLVSDGAEISFDQAGHAETYGYEISIDAHITRIRFNGLTGWYEIEEGGEQ